MTDDLGPRPSGAPQGIHRFACGAAAEGRFPMLALALAALLGGCGDDTPRTLEEAARKVTLEAARPVIDSPAPGFRLERLDGGTFDSADLRGKVTLVNFWAPWCPPCVQELPELARVHVAVRSRGGQVMGIALAQPEDVLAFVADHPLPFPLLLGGREGQALARQMGDAHGALPYSVVIDAAGIIRAAHAGRLDEARADALITPFLPR
ncbi:MAG TPA: TlpA family protein disulfide reductase [Chromatiales bacterium]|nr:TlpA family protein disulfide reductase [Chromatiales bacterium]